jgi:hypothetical protein
MSARLIPEASPTFALPVPIPASAVLISDPEFSKTLSAALSAFVCAIRLDRNLVRGVSQALEEVPKHP